MKVPSRTFSSLHLLSFDFGLKQEQNVYWDEVCVYGALFESLFSLFLKNVSSGHTNYTLSDRSAMRPAPEQSIYPQRCGSPQHTIKNSRSTVHARQHCEDHEAWNFYRSPCSRVDSGQMQVHLLTLCFRFTADAFSAFVWRMWRTCPTKLWRFHISVMTKSNFMFSVTGKLQVRSFRCQWLDCSLRSELFPVNIFEHSCDDSDTSYSRSADVPEQNRCLQLKHVIQMY